MKHYVYRLDDPITKEFYIGSRSCLCDIKDDKYMGSYSTWKPENKSKIVKTILKSNFRKRETAIRYEAILIKEYINDDLNRNYHIPNEGFHTTGTQHTSETIEKILKAREGYVHTQETKLKIGKSHIGLSHSSLTKEKISIARRNHICTQETKDKIGNSNKGNIHTIETRLIMSKLAKNRSDTVRMNISIGCLNQKKYTCTICSIETTAANIKRWHNNNCKNILNK